MKNNKLQCKDIPTKPILEYLLEHGGIGCSWYKSVTWNRTVRHAFPLNIPESLILAKMRTLMKNGLVDGCSCGRRGDFELTLRGKIRLSEYELENKENE